MASPSFAEDVLNNKKLDLVYCAKIVHALYNQQKSGELCDVKVLVENQSFYIHRCILATTSDQLHSQISNLNTIELVGVTKQGFETLLEILYTGKLNGLASLTLEEFHELLKAADALDAGTVMDYCMREHPSFMSQILENREMDETVEIKTVSRSKRLSRMRDEGSYRSMGIVALKLKKFIPNSSQSDSLLQLNYVKVNDTPPGSVEETVSTTRITSVKSPENSRAKPDEDDEEEDDHMCSLCGKIFKFEKYLQKHVKYGGCANRLNCFYCPRKYKRQQDLKKHVTQYHSEYLAKSSSLTKPKSRRGNPVSKKDSEDEEELEETIEVEDEDEKEEEQTVQTEFCCLVCSQKFNSNRGLLNHQRQHRSSYRCKTCEKIFFNYKNYRIHKAKKCNKLPSTLKCSLCSKTYTRIQDLKKHMISRHPNKANASPKTEVEKPVEKRDTGYRYNCKTCDKKFRSKVQLRSHMTEHEEEEEVPPPQDVEMTEERQPTPPEPKVVVTDEDDGFACIHCGNIFNSLSAMRKHVDANHGDGMADIKVFNITDASEEKVVYTCETCNENFDDTQSLEAHVAVHDNAVAVPTVTCEACKVVFSNQECYNIHACIKQEIPANGFDEEFPSPPAADKPDTATVNVTTVEKETEKTTEEEKEASVVAID